MPPRNPHKQSGYMLLLLVILFMGISGIVIAGFTQGAIEKSQQERYRHNQRVLNEAKQALLMYAYNYPEIALEFNGTIRGPGRLPCPDIDNTGTPNTANNCIFAGNVPGRFPWRTNGLQFYDARDASNERLWYAVSQNFNNFDAADVINSATLGTINIHDQSGAVLYDSSTGGGVVAVIIAPGPAIERNGVLQDRSVANADNRFDTVADTDPGIINPANYLDLFGALDNADFINDDAGNNGFVLGPIDSRAADSIIVNDQMVVITAQEIIEVAEKRVLQAYRDAIDEYLALTGNVYPWLYNYVGVADLPSMATYFPAYPQGNTFNSEISTNLDNHGRIPSSFAEYFTETDSQPIETRYSGNLSLTYPLWPIPVGSSGSGNQYFNDGAQTIIYQTSDKLTGVRFVDIADSVGQDARLTGTVVTPQTFTGVIYFWDEDDGPATGRWTACLDDGDGIPEVEDCNRDSAGNPKPGGNNDRNSEVLRVVLGLDFNGTVSFDADYSTPPATAIAPADDDGHAIITATFAGGDIIGGSSVLNATYQIDRHYHDDETSFDPSESGVLDLNDMLAGISLEIGIRFYPQLPLWAFDNDWHDSVMMAYADDYRPDVVAPPCDEAGGQCLRVDNSAGNRDNKVALLLMAGERGWVNDAGPDFDNDLGDVFDAENANRDNVFDAAVVRSNDKLLVMDEL